MHVQFYAYQLSALCLYTCKHLFLFIQSVHVHYWLKRTIVISVIYNCFDHLLWISYYKTHKYH